MAFAAECFGHAEVDAHGFGMADVDVAVGFRRETRDNLAAGRSGRDVFFNPLPEKMS